MVCEKMLRELSERGVPMENGVYYFDAFDRMYVQASLIQLSGSAQANRGVFNKIALPRRYRITLSDLCKTLGLTHLNGIDVSTLTQSIKIGYLICGAGIDWLAKNYHPKKSPFGNSIRVWREKCPAKKSVEPPQEIIDFLAQKGSNSESDNDSEVTACETDSDADVVLKPRKTVAARRAKRASPKPVKVVREHSTSPAPHNFLTLPENFGSIDPDTQIRLYEARCKMLEMETRNLELKRELGLTSSTS